MRGRSFKTQSDIDRHIEKALDKEVRGFICHGYACKTFRHGRLRKVHGVKVDRLHHLLSDLEYGYLLVAEFPQMCWTYVSNFPSFRNLRFSRLPML